MSASELILPGADDEMGLPWVLMGELAPGACVSPADIMLDISVVASWCL